MIEALRQARTRRAVRAIVLRVDSPGGSAIASDVIWREVQLARASKPVVASMSDVAASGGYYVAMPAHAIVAEPGTLTGSIGVVMGKFALAGTFDKLGLGMDAVSDEDIELRNAAGEVVELRCTYDPATRGGDAPDGRKVQGTIHWVSAARALDVTLRLYDKLLSVAAPDAVLGLEEPYRALILLHYHEGRELREIAAASGEPLATVRSRHARALERHRGQRARVPVDCRWHGGPRRRRAWSSTRCAGRRATPCRWRWCAGTRRCRCR